MDSLSPRPPRGFQLPEAPRGGEPLTHPSLMGAIKLTSPFSTLHKRVLTSGNGNHLPELQPGSPYHSRAGKRERDISNVNKVKDECFETKSV